MDAALYFSRMPKDRQIGARSVQAIVLDLYPQVRVSLKYKMPTYESESGWLAIGNQKHHWAVYTCGADKIEDYLAAHPEVKHGKGCLHFRPRDTVDPAAMQEVVRKALSRER